jgi:hypothetical protein
MWQHRQEGRDMKRAEADIKKTQLQLQRAIQLHEQEAEKKQKEKQRALQEKEFALVKYEQQDLHSRKATMESKIRQMRETNKRKNTESQRDTRSQNQEEFLYQTLCQAVDLKQAEVQRLTKEFEEKIRRKEEEQSELEKRLAEVAITRNMAAQKRRQQVADETRQRSQQVMKEMQERRGKDNALELERQKIALAQSQYENNKRTIAKDLRYKREALKLHVRETARHLSDIHTQLEKNTGMQLRIQEAGDYLDAEQQLKQCDEKMQTVEAKRQAMLTHKQRDIQEKNTKEKFQWEKRVSERHLESKRKEHEEKLKFLSQIVQKQEDLERSLYKQVHAAEVSRRKQDDVVNQLQAELDAKKRENARQLKELAVQTQRVEEDLKQQIIKETAELTKAIHEKQEGLRLLTQSRYRTQEERYMLEEEKREHDRVKRIELLSLAMQSHP